MKVFLAIVVAIFSGLIGVNLGTESVFPRLLEARFPSNSMDGFLKASSQCEHYSFLFFVVSAFAGVAVFAHFLGKEPKPRVLIGILTALAAGAMAGALSCAVYFYSTYSN